jgi:hypothetical protein
MRHGLLSVQILIGELRVKHTTARHTMARHETCLGETCLGAPNPSFTKQSGHMSQTTRSHVTNNPVTCHKQSGHHRIPSHPTRELRAKHCAPNPSSFGHMQTHSFLFFILTTFNLREIHHNIHLEESVLN